MTAAITSVHPTWCTEDHDDLFGSVLINNPAVQVEIHSVKVSDDVAVCQQELRYPDGRVVFEQPYAASYIDELPSDPVALVEHGRAILQAAAKLREVTS